MKWEYECVDIEREFLKRTLTRYGEAGWQLAAATTKDLFSVTMFTLIFKRAVNE
jgi:hypothetical protein